MNTDVVIEIAEIMLPMMQIMGQQQRVTIKRF